MNFKNHEIIIGLAAGARLFVGAFVLASLSGCSSVSSVKHSERNENDGLLYFMPRQDMILTVTIANPEEGGAAESATRLRPASASSEVDDEKDKKPANEDDKDKKGEKKSDEKPKPAPAITKPTLVQSFTGKLGKKTVKAETTSPYPDRGQAYWLQFGANWLGKNTLDIGVSANGLLQSASSKTEPGISAALIGLAKGLAQQKIMGFDGGNDRADPCKADIPGTYTFHVSFEQALSDDRDSSSGPCGLKVIALDMTELGEDVVLDAYQPPSKGNGIYYRQTVPYAVIIANDDGEMVGLLSSPSLSGTYFLPVNATLFAQSSAEFTFQSGIPTKYKQESDGELVGLLKIPADVIAAYFGAIGETLGSLSSNAESESALIQAELDLELAKLRQEQCLAAIEAEDTAAITTSCIAPEPE